MKIVNRYKDILLNWFYLDEDGMTVRRAKDGYRGHYKKGDVVTPYTLCSHGYNGVHVPTTRMTVPYHHLITLLRGIDIPDDAVIDHINGDTTDNRAENIRVTTQLMNCRNTRKKSNNTSGVTGINKAKDSSTYIVRKQIQGKRVYLGCRRTMEEAIELLNSYDAVLKAEGYTERHGK